MTDAIFALSSGRGKAGVAVVRASGADLRGLFYKIRNRKSKIISRHAYLADLSDEDGAVIDRGIAIYFPGPNSFTGEDVVEFHVHGSCAAVEKLFSALRALGARMAEPGEFARRAFDNGKMDLTEVDGLAALLDARTDAQRRAALRSAAGADSAVYEKWRSEMLRIAAYSAAILDYPSDELPAGIREDLLARTRGLHAEISAAVSRSAAARAIRSGFNIVIAGPVNAGKSSLFNRLAGEGRAIVSDIPGTTRDVVSAEIDLDGYLARIADTAGLRDAGDALEKIGIERANAEIENADLVIKVQTANRAAQPKKNEIVVVNKSDLLPDDDRASRFADCMLVSALTGEGIPELLDLIKRKVHEMLDGAESDIAVNERAKTHLTAAMQELETSLEQSENMDLLAEHIRRAADETGRILGVIGTSEIADSVFGQLCLGK